MAQLAVLALQLDGDSLNGVALSGISLGSLRSMCSNYNESVSNNKSIISL